jgi:hypothetical protein
VGELLTGTVTMLFSDIEGSTALLGRLGDRYGEALEAHRAIGPPISITRPSAPTSSGPRIR